MKIRVVEITPQRNTEQREHEAPVLDHDTSDGELRITARDPDGKVIGWTLYAAGQWLSAALIEPVSPEVARHRGLAAERDRQPANGGRGFTVPGGNSGPQ